MPRLTKSKEASLLFTQPPRLETGPMAEAVETLLTSEGLDVAEIRDVPGSYALLTCDTVEVLIAPCAVPFPIDHFKGALRPANATRDGDEVMALLHDHRASVTVLVVERAPAAPVPEARLAALCWQITDFLAAAITPDLVFWCAQDMLYAVEEFEDVADNDDRATAAQVAPILPMEQDASRASRARFYTDPHLTPEAAAWLGTGTAGPRDARAESAEAGPPQIADLAETPAGSATVYVMSTTLIIVAFPVGYAMLIFNLMSGGNFRATARAMALTGIAAAASTVVGLPAQAMALF